MSKLNDEKLSLVMLWEERRILYEQCMDLQLFYRIGRMLAMSESWPNWVEGDEFKATRDETCTAEGAACGTV